MKTFDSNGLEKADYSRGVLERFTRCEPNCGLYVKNIVNPRRIRFFSDPHTMHYFESFFGVDENFNTVTNSIPQPAIAEKIVINHYICKTWEEYLIKIQRGDAVFAKNPRCKERFDRINDQKAFDDGILKYRDAKSKVYQPPKPRSDVDLIKALERNLSPTLSPDTPLEFYAGKMETFLTCRAVAAYLQTKLVDNSQTKLYEETVLEAILKSLSKELTVADKDLLITELPNILPLSYPVVKEILRVISKTINFKWYCNQYRRIITKLLYQLHLDNKWDDYALINYLLEIF